MTTPVEAGGAGATQVAEASQPKADGGKKKSGKDDVKGYQWAWLIPLTMTSGIAALGIYSWALHSWTVLGYGIAVSAAAILAGGLVGFVFGIPISNQGSGQQPSKDNANPTDNSYKDNTNLEQISDWLTKILVGVGLVQLGRATAGLSRLAAAMAPGFGGQTSSAGFGLALTLFYAGTGFLYLYLWSRTGFLRELRSLQKSIQQVATAAAEVKAKEVAKSESTDQVGSLQSELQNVLSLVDRALYPNSGADTPTQEELDAAMKDASPYARQQAFQRAESQRRHYWRSNRPVMELTIPVFRSLIASDTENVHHRNHGELGFALKDKSEPDWQEALDELTKAIEMRGKPASEKGWAAYEAVRAICRINLDRQFENREPSAPEVVADVVADLAVAATDDFAKLFIGKPDVKRWLRINRDAVGVDPSWIDYPDSD